MLYLYYCEPVHEPNGEGNGWEKCHPKHAACWVVMQHALSDRLHAHDVAVEAFDSWEEANDCAIASMKEEIRQAEKGN